MFVVVWWVHNFQFCKKSARTRAITGLDTLELCFKLTLHTYWVQYDAQFRLKLESNPSVNWRASEASETLSGISNGNRRYIFIYIYIYGT